MNASVIDMKSGRVGGGLSYQRQDLKNNSSKDPAFGGAKRLDQFFKLGLFTPASEKLYVGTNVKYTIRDFEDPALGKDKENWDFDLGALYIVNKDLSFGTVFKNVLQGDNVVEAQSIAVGGTYYFQTNISVSGQVEYLTDGQDLAVQPSERMSWSVAAAYNFLEEYGVSAGYRSHPSFEQELISAGLKFQSEKYGVQYAFQYDLDGESTTNHSLGASFYF